MTPILDAILEMTPFPMSDSGRLLVCYLTRQILPKSVRKPFVSIFLGFNLRLTRLRLDTSPETIELELRPAVCEHRQKNYSIDIDSHFAITAKMGDYG